MRGDGGDAADALRFVCGGGEARTAAEGRAHDHEALGAVVLREVVERGDDVRGAVGTVGCEAVVETHAGYGKQERQFVC